MTGYRSKELTEAGKRKIVFNPSQGYKDLEVTIACGQCVGCRLERSRQWAIRCVHEAQMHNENCFITLTYNPKHLPKDKSLNVEHFKKFMKRFRKRYGKVRYFHCGEYGEKTKRPHYHACIFGYNFDDLELVTARTKFPVYTSKKLQQLWSCPNCKEPIGFVQIGTLTFESAAYVSRYIMKKVTGEKAKELNEEGLTPYEWVDKKTGEVFDLKPEYTTMSRRPGIGKDWYDKYKNDVYNYDYVVIRGKKMKAPKYYDRVFEVEFPDEFNKLKGKRKNNIDNQNYEDLEREEKFKKVHLKMLPRTLE